MRKATTILLAAVLICVGCAASRPPETPSGKAEVTIAKSEQQRFTDALVRNASERGYSVLDVSTYKAAFDKEGNVGTSIGYGSGTRRRLTFDFVPQGDSLRIIGRLEAIGSRGDIKATRTGQDIQEFLLKTLSEFETGDQGAKVK